MAYTDKELLTIDPELDELFKKRGVPKLPTPTLATIPAFRKNYAKTLARFNSSPFAQAALGLVGGAKPTWTEHDRTMPMRDGVERVIRIYTPLALPADGAAVLLMIHAGGWFMGDLETEQFLCQLFCSRMGVIMVNLDFRYYPEVKFPVPITDVFDAVKWIAGNASSFKGNLNKGFLIGGTSGGGTFAAIAAYLARDENVMPPLTGMFLFCPILSAQTMNDKDQVVDLYPGRVRSPEQNANAPLMTRGMQDAIRELAEYDFRSPLLTPFLFTEHANLPPVYVVATGLDPWRDGAILFGEVLQEAGGTAKLDVYPGLPHCWWTTFPQLQATQTWLSNTLAGMRWLLSNNRRVTRL